MEHYPGSCGGSAVWVCGGWRGAQRPQLPYVRVWTCGGRDGSKNWVIQQCFSSFGIYLCSISLSSGSFGGAWARGWPSFGDQLPPDEDVTTSKACGTVDSVIKIKSKHKLSPEITVEKEESVAERTSAMLHSTIINSIKANTCDARFTNGITKKKGNKRLRRCASLCV